DVVVRFPLELEVHPREGERAEALTRTPPEPETDRSRWQADVAVPLGDPPGDARAHREVVVADVVHAGERAAGVEPRRERGEYLVVERLDARTVIARHGATAWCVACRDRVGEEQRQVEHLRAGHLGMIHALQQLHPSDGVVERAATQCREQAADVLGDPREVRDHLLRRAAELRPQLGFLSRDAGGTGVEVALPGHVATDRDERGRAEPVALGAAQSRADDVTPRPQASLPAYL